MTYGTCTPPGLARCNPQPLQLYRIWTSLRTVCIWVEGFERTALGAYRRTVGETVYAVTREA